MLKPRSLRQRFTLFILLPVGLLLVCMGYAGFRYARDSLLEQWTEAAILKLERAAHRVDMRLGVPKEWMRMYLAAADKPSADIVQERIIERLGRLEGVERVHLTWFETTVPLSSSTVAHSARQPGMSGLASMRRFVSGKITAISPPVYDPDIRHETVSLVSELKDENEKNVGRLDVVMHFDELIRDVVTSGWWERQKAFLVDDSGRILTCTVAREQKPFCDQGALHRETLVAMKEKAFGTVFGKGLPPSEVSGFYRLREAPWTLIIVAPGDEILAPLIRFRNYYAVTVIGFILFILLLIRWVTGFTVSAIREVSRAARYVAGGRYGIVLPVGSRDEVGELTRSFNTMVRQLEDRMRLKESMDLAMAVQQGFLPQNAFQFANLEIAGESVYCDETGGDYYDFLQFPELGKGKIGIAVGDVVGHGIASALLMTTTRAMVRSRIIQSGALSGMVTDINRMICEDTEHSGNFMTLFFSVIDTSKGEIRWVRAGHEPALLFDPRHKRFEELKGAGMALGVEREMAYEENVKKGFLAGQILLIGTDGIWETQNVSGEMFGKQRLKDLIRRHAAASAEQIVRRILDALMAFAGAAPLTDDITLVVIKRGPDL